MPIAIIIIMPRDWLEGLRVRGMSLGLDMTHRALERLGNPQKASKAIHVAGSNGKGTTCAILSAALILSGQKVGTFTSPHVSRIEVPIFDIADTEDGRISFDEFMNGLLGKPST